jgi:hypothetical protein
MPHAQERSKRDGRHESTIAAHVFRKAEWWDALCHCERSEAIQSVSAEKFWIASLRSQ